MIRTAILVMISCAFFAAASRDCAAQSILVYDNNSQRQTALNAVAGLGFTAQRATSGDFFTFLTGGTWDLVIMDMPSTVPTGAWTTALETYIAGGGRVIHTAWSPGTFTPTLQAALQVTTTGTHNTLSFFRWTSHPLFAGPNSVPSGFTTWLDVWGSNGFFLQPVGSAVAAAGFTMTPTANQAAIVISSTNRTIMNGFLFDDFDSADLDMDGAKDIVELVQNEIMWLLGVQCSITSPAPAAVVSGNVDVVFDANDVMGMPISIFLEWSTDGGVTFGPATVTPTSMLTNPVVGVAVPVSAASFTWDSLTDMVGRTSIQTTLARITVDNGMFTSSCSVSLDVDNRAPPPTCTMVAPLSPWRGEVAIDVDAQSINSPTVDITIEYSTNAGLTFQQATMAPGSASTNPAISAAIGVSSFTWDSRADSVGLAAPATGVILRATVDDGVATTTGACQQIGDVDNTMLCFGICGDCNLNAAGPDIIDALTAAQIAVMLIVPTITQTACCDVNSSLNVDVIDALFMAQFAAGLPAVLTCM